MLRADQALMHVPKAVRVARNAKSQSGPIVKKWLKGLQGIPEEGPPPKFTTVVRRFVHPGLMPVAGNGLIAAQPVRQVELPGMWAHSMSLLHWISADSGAGSAEVEQRDSAFGALLTLVANRRCNVLNEVMAKVEGQEKTICIPVAARVDSVLTAPMPEWDRLDASLRRVAGLLASLSDADGEALAAAMHLHHCAALLTPHDVAAAYALVIAGLEALAQHFGSPTHEWADWDKATGWDRWSDEQRLSATQRQSLRDRLMRDSHIRLSETFATYVSTRLPQDFWKQDVAEYTWGVDGLTGTALPGAWGKPAPRARFLAENPGLAKQALKKSYQARSRFLHAGTRVVSQTREWFGDGPGEVRELLSLAQARAALRELILIELSERGVELDTSMLRYELSGDV